jgi:MerR family copper efflux transcriptional regulator
MKINELASKTELSTHTIRFYEKEGLLDERHVIRTTNNYREYNDDALERLKLIKKFQGIDCSLTEIKRILHDKENNLSSDKDVAKWIQHKIKDVEVKKREYDQMLLTLGKMLKYRTGKNKSHT